MSPEPPGLRIDGLRLKRSILKLASIGATSAGGVNRLSLTADDKEARQALVRWMKEIGLAVSVDQMGNMFGRLEGENPSLPPVVVGSHIDTVPFGGKLDGAYGVLSSLELMRTLAENSIKTMRPIEMVSWTNEEGTRFQPGMMGSSVFAGKLDLDFAYSRTDKYGNVFEKELERIGFKGAVPCKPRELHSYLELHIEQGPILDKQHIPMGIVEGIVGIRWFRVTVEGESNHAGPTPMGSRRDALVATADMIRAIRDIPSKTGKGLVSTVGSLDVHPNSINIIPGKVVFTIDFRCYDEKALEDAIAAVKEEIATLARQESCNVQIETLEEYSHVVFSKRTVSIVERSASELGLSHIPIVSGAGHDAQCLNAISETAMIFVPSKRGKSHCEDEETDWKDIEHGANVLFKSALTLANEN